MSHIHEKIDFCAEVFIVFQNKVLLRKHDKFKIWLSVGGHIELDEDPNEAVVREAQEEVGLEIALFNEDEEIFSDEDVKSLVTPQYIIRHIVAGEHEHVGLIYFAESKTDKLNLSTIEVTDECRWFTKKELEENSFGISRRVRLYALKALEKLAA